MNALLPSMLAAAVLVTASLALGDEPIWTETFDDGVGRFDQTLVWGDVLFVWDETDQLIDGVFRRDGSTHRRFADLGFSLDGDDAFGFSVVVTPRERDDYSNGLAVTGHFGFFNSKSAGAQDAIGFHMSVGGPWEVHPFGIDSELRFTVTVQQDTTYFLLFLYDGASGNMEWSVYEGIDATGTLLGTFVHDTSLTTISADSLAIGVEGTGFDPPQVPDAWCRINVDDFSLIGADCNENGIFDLQEIADGTSNDADENGIPDECECPADLTGNGVVNAADLAELLGAWGPCPEPPADCPADIHGGGDGIVRADDLATLLGAWGPCE